MRKFDYTVKKYSFVSCRHLLEFQCMAIAGEDIAMIWSLQRQ